MIVAFGLESSCCLVCFLCCNQLSLGIEYFMGHDVFGSLRVYFIYELCISSIGFIELWDIAQVAFLQLLAYR
jgi:hypothetical protein